MEPAGWRENIMEFCLNWRNCIINTLIKYSHAHHPSFLFFHTPSTRLCYYFTRNVVIICFREAHAFNYKQLPRCSLKYNHFKFKFKKITQNINTVVLSNIHQDHRSSVGLQLFTLAEMM